MSPLYGGPQPGLSTPGVALPMLRITSLHLLITLLLRQPSVPLALFATRLHCWLKLSPGSMTLWHISHSSQLGVISKFAEGTLCPIIQIINESVKQGWTQC